MKERIDLENISDSFMVTQLVEMGLFFYFFVLVFDIMIICFEKINLMKDYKMSQKGGRYLGKVVSQEILVMIYLRNYGGLSMNSESWNIQDRINLENVMQIELLKFSYEWYNKEKRN